MVWTTTVCRGNANNARQCGEVPSGGAAGVAVPAEGQAVAKRRARVLGPFPWMRGHQGQDSRLDPDPSAPG